MFGTTENKLMIDYVKQQLRNGKLIPWKYREFGIIAVTEMYYDFDDIAASRKTTTRLLQPTKHDLEGYSTIRSGLASDLEHAFKVAGITITMQQKMLENRQPSDTPCDEAKHVFVRQSMATGPTPAQLAVTPIGLTTTDQTPGHMDVTHTSSTTTPTPDTNLAVTPFHELLCQQDRTAIMMKSMEPDLVVAAPVFGLTYNNPSVVPSSLECNIESKQPDEVSPDSQCESVSQTVTEYSSDDERFASPISTQLLKT